MEANKPPFDKLRKEEQDKVLDALLQVQNLRQQDLFEYPYTDNRSREILNQCKLAYNKIAHIAQQQTTSRETPRGQDEATTTSTSTASMYKLC